MTDHTTADDPRHDRVDDTIRVVLRPIASPFALGFLALAGATMLLSGLELGWIPSGAHTQVALFILLFAPPLQLVASVFGFLGRDAVAGTGMGVLAATWAAIGVRHLLLPSHALSPALGTLLCVSSAALLLSATTAATSKGVPAAVMGTTSLRFLATAIYEFTDISAARTTTGVIGCVLAALAVYAAFATELEGQHRRAVLPMLRHGGGGRVYDPYLDEQVQQVASEPGVRKDL